MKKKQSDWDQFYLKVAELTSQQSYAQDRKVGAIIVKHGNIIAFSYNGTLQGRENSTCDQYGKTLPTVLHAESQAIAKVARSPNNTEGATLYTTLSPCIECAKLIVQSGISRVVYKEPFKYTEGIDFLEHAGVMVNKHCLFTDEQLKHTGLLSAD